MDLGGGGNEPGYESPKEMLPFGGGGFQGLSLLKEKDTLGKSTMKKGGVFA